MGKAPLITIVGVPNTGKSTLFNRLLGKNKALVHARPGMTRDIFRMPLEINGRQYRLQDSGGFFEDGEDLTRDINQRIFNETERSDLVIFLLDGRRDLLGFEKDLFLTLRKTGVPILAVANKIDHPQGTLSADSHYSLGVDLLLISAEHNLGMDTLIEEIESRLADRAPAVGEADPPETRITLVGKPNVGKSSLVNGLLREKRVIVSPLPGTTRDSIDLDLTISGRRYVLVDNAGIRKLQKVREGTESAAVVRAAKNIRLADIVVFVLDASRKIDHNDLFIARKVIASAKPVVVACNKWDMVQGERTAQDVLRGLQERFQQFYFAPFLLTSAETGKNLNTLIQRIQAVQSLIHGGVKTARLNQIVRESVSGKRLMLESGRPFRPKYSVLESTRPFFIRFFAGREGRLRRADEIYLKKRIVKQLGMEGIPIFFNIVG